ncbi:DNA-binding protein [Pseudoalteromonas sp. T1lg48]|uniref:DNA-binding protein n=1 Tax=Pseudoalteromonas sp. T1lg48 TaxID=2077100 RepID=UPI000CF62616|nr:DNA-binding protein [Pseudoalteromonas sp. T1lg48]
MNQLRFGTNFTGICKGVKQNLKTNKQTGEQYNEIFVGIAIPKANGFEGEETIFDIQIGKKAQDAGLPGILAESQGKTITVPIFQRHRSWKEKVYSNTYLGTSEAKDIVIHQKAS